MVGRKRALGVDVGDDAIRVVALQPSGAGYAVTLAAYLPLAEGESAAEALSAFARDGRAGGGRGACSLPAAECAVKTATLPPAAPAELAQVVRFEAETQFPLPLPEMVWHYTLTPGTEGKPHAAIVGARRPAVENRLSLLQGMGLPPAVLLPAPLAAARAIAHPAGAHLLVVAGAQWSDLCLYTGDNLLASRSVLAGPADAAEWAPRIVREARPWLMGSEHPSSIVLVGDVSKETAAALEGAGHLPVTLGDPWADVRDEHGLQAKLDDAPAAYAAAIGLAKAALARNAGLNLLPEQIGQARAQRRALGWWAALLLLAAGALGLLAWQGQGRLAAAQQARQQAEAAEHAAFVKLPATPGGGLVAAQRVTDALAAPASRPFDLLARLSDAKTGLPAGMSLTDFAYERAKGMLTLKGHANASDLVASAVESLGALPGVSRAQLVATTAADDGKGFEFQITCELQAGDDPTVTRLKRSGAEARR